MSKFKQGDHVHVTNGTKYPFTTPEKGNFEGFLGPETLQSGEFRVYPTRELALKAGDGYQYGHIGYIANAEAVYKIRDCVPVKPAPSREVWITADSRALFPSEMTKEHVENCIEFLKIRNRALTHERSKHVEPEKEQAIKARFDHADKWIKIFTEELERRKPDPKVYMVKVGKSYHNGLKIWGESQFTYKQSEAMKIGEDEDGPYYKRIESPSGTLPTFGRDSTHGHDTTSAKAWARGIAKRLGGRVVSITPKAE